MYSIDDNSMAKNGEFVLKMCIFILQPKFNQFISFQALKMRILSPIIQTVCQRERNNCAWMRRSQKQVNDLLQRIFKAIFILKLIELLIFRTDFGLFNYILKLLCGLVQISVAMETMGITYILPVAECDLELNSARKGILAGTTFVGAIFSSHLWGYLADTKGRRRIIQPTLLVAFLISVVSSFIQNFYLFTVLRFMNGFL